MNPFDDLNKQIAEAWVYTPKTGVELMVTDLDNIYEWAEEIAGEWNGDESGSEEDRAHQANDIIEKLNEVKELILEMSEL